MGPADMDEPGPGHGHAQEGEDPPERGPASTDACGRPFPGAAHPSLQFRRGPGLAAPVPPGHHPGRKKKILAWTAAGVAVVVLVALGGAYAVYRHLNGNIHQVNISGELGTQPVDTHPQAENIMVIGSDTATAWARATARASPPTSPTP